MNLFLYQNETTHLIDFKTDFFVFLSVYTLVKITQLPEPSVILGWDINNLENVLTSLKIKFLWYTIET